MKKAIHNFSKLLAWAFFGVALFSCSNASGGYDSSSSNRKSYPVVRFVANMQADFAAAPQEISSLVSRSAGTTSFLNDGASRSAMPSVEISDTESGAKYYIEAVCGTERKFNYGTTSTLELGLESGKTWNVTCGIGEIEPDSATPSDHTKGTVLTVLMSDNDPSVTITPDEPVYVKTFGLKPSITTDGTGTINLNLKIMYDTWYVKVSCSAQGWKDANGGAETVLLDGSTTLLLHIGSIKSGIYDVVFKFYDDKGALNYCTVQSINVFDDMTTSVWRDDGSGAVVTEGGQTVFKVTDAVINLFTQTTMYVGDTGLGLAPDNQNSGTAFEPLATLQEAAYRIRKYGNGKDYTIFVGGTVQGCATFDDDITRDQAKTITIMGYNDSGDKLKGYASKLGNIVNFNGVTISTYFPESKEFNPVITVKTAVPITIQNVDICEGASNGGSGINIDGSACSVTIKDGVTISGNKTGKNGGGVLVVGGKFYMKGGKITGNSAFNSGSGTCNGGGVCLGGGAYFEMTGGEISLNRACHGGGVGLVNLGSDSGSNKFIFKRGKISQNTADGFVSGGSKCGYGGGIMIMSGSETVHHQVTMTGGEISGNKVNVDSSAVEVSSSAIFEMTGGVIKDNSLIEGESDANYHDISVRYSAKYFCLGGSAYIPAGSGKNHCVYLNSLKDGSNPLQMAKINVDSNLSRHSQSDPLVIQFNESGEHAALRGATVASASFDLTDAKEYIVPASDDWNLKLSSDKKSLVLDAPIWVAGSDAKQCAGTPSEYGPGTKSAPYKSIYHACAAMTDPSVDYTILIDGTLTGPQETRNVETLKAASITIQGANGDNSVDVLDGNSYNEHVLSLYAQADTTIKDLKITGANITTEDTGTYRTHYGGGVYSFTDKSVTLSSGTLIAGNRTVNGGGGVYKENGKLIIEDGAEISGSNMAANGGGVYLYNASLYMGGGKISGNSASGSGATGRGGGIYCDGGNLQPSNVYLWGKALVGRADISAPPTSSGSAHANDAMTGGGIYVYNGNLWLGYKDANKPQAFEEVAAGVLGGIVGNYATQKGGGVYIDTSVYNNNLCMASGQIACNGTQTQVAYNGNGGGIYILNDGRPIVDISGGSVKNNRSYKGGAIYNDGSSIAQLKIGGAADIPYGTDKKNDVYLNNNYSLITLASSLSPREAKNAIAITLNTSGASPFTHGSTVFKTDPERLVSSDELNCVKLSAEHEAAGLALTLSSDCKSIKLDKPIYVRQGGSADADGTKTKPFDSIQAACGAMNNDSLDYTILVDGIDPSTGDPMPLLGAQTIPEGTLAASITIRGANGFYTSGDKAGEPKDALNGNNCSAPVLTAECSRPVVLGNIKITGAKNGANGGGVWREKGDLYIQEGTLITRNIANQGAGVFVSRCNLYMSGGQITSNESTISNGTYSGGICLTGNTSHNNGAFIYGKAVIGGVNKEHPACPTSTTTKDDVLNNGGNWCANQRGGGVGCFDANLYLGYKSASGSDGAPTSADVEEWTGGIYGNYVGGEGGGVYVRGKMYMNSGEIAYNYTKSNGGGVYNAGDFTMTGGEIYGNAVSASGAGGGVANNVFFGMSGGKIYANDGGLLGGGVYQSSGSSEIALSGTAVIGDTSKPNVAKQGGGIGCKENVASLTRIGWFDGSVRYNFTGGLMGNQATAGSGGAIYMNKSSKLCFYAGRISGNTASAGKGNGVYVHPEADAIEMKGYVRFDASDDIWLAPPESGDPKTITISKDNNVSGLHPTDTGASGGTAADKTATITPGAYNVGDTILTGTTDALVSGNYAKFAVAPDPADSSETWILDSDGCLYNSHPALVINQSNGMSSSASGKTFIKGAVIGSGTEDDPYVLELGALDTLNFQIKGGIGSKAVYSAESIGGMTSSHDFVKPNYSILYNWTIPDEGIKKKMLIVSNIGDPDNEVEAPFWVLLKKPQYFMGTPYKANDDGTVLFGDWPQTIKASSVNVSEIKVNQEGGWFDYYLGSDGFWYVSQAENGYDPGGAFSWAYNKNYSDGTQVGTGNSSSKWFKVEPIKWKVLATDAGKKLLHAQSILEGRRFAENNNTYNNIYSGSEIQTYLQGLFYRSAFAPAIRNNIQSTTISSGSQDMVFLLGHDDTVNSAYFSNDAARIRAPTDFAKATGALHNYGTGGGIWWTRDSGELNVYCVNSEGGANDEFIPPRSEIGLAPAMWIMP